MSVGGFKKLSMIYDQSSDSFDIEYANHSYLQDEMQKWWEWFSSKVLVAFESSYFGQRIPKELRNEEMLKNHPGIVVAERIGGGNE